MVKLSNYSRNIVQNRTTDIQKTSQPVSRYFTKKKKKQSAVDNVYLSPRVDRTQANREFLNKTHNAGALGSIFDM